MNWDAIGAIGELIGAVAVLVSLLYLAIQIRLNTRSVSSASYQAAIASISQLPIQLGLDGETARIARIGFTGDFQELNEDEQYRFTLFVTGLFRNFENFYFQYESGVMPDHLWEGMRNSMVGYVNAPNVRAWWDQRKVIYSPRFAEFLEAQPRLEEAERTIFVGVNGEGRWGK